MLTSKGIEVYNRENKHPYEGNIESIRYIETEEKWKTDYTRTKSDINRDIKEEIYRKNLHYTAPSVGSVPDKEGNSESEGSQKVNEELERLFGTMGSGKGYGIQPTSKGIPIFDDTPIKFEL